MKYDMRILINFRSLSLSCAHLRLQVVSPCIPTEETRFCGDFRSLHFGGILYYVFFAFSVRGRPATGKLIVETQDYRALTSRKFCCPYLECTWNCSSRTEGNFLRYSILKIAIKPLTCHGADFLLADTLNDQTRLEICLLVEVTLFEIRIFTNHKEYARLTFLWEMYKNG